MLEINEVHIYYDPKPVKLHRTGIEYLDFNWGIESGCKHYKTGVCGGGGQDFKCWAKGTVEGRAKNSYPFGFQPTIYPDRFLQPLAVKKPSRFGVAFMGDLGGEWIDPDMNVTAFRQQKYPNNWPLREHIFSTIQECPQHDFLFLTKNLSAWQKWGKWPDNAWVGCTITNNFTYIGDMALVRAKHKWLSIEPLVEWRDFPGQNARLPAKLKEWGFEWLVLGGFSGGKRQPGINAVRELVEIADKAGVPVFLKNNILELVNYVSKETDFAFNKDGFYRQEFPNTQRKRIISNSGTGQSRS